MSMKMADGTIFGTLVEYGHHCMTQWLQINPGVPDNKKELDETVLVQWQSKLRCVDCMMLYCGCKSEMDPDSAMIFADNDGQKYFITLFRLKLFG